MNELIMIHLLYNLKEREVPNVDSTVDTENVIPLVFT